ncbi:MAG: hypothetical protein KDE03_02435 [Rhodobacteraceae bacterium]|nr:hypothetical protein [Paracoccaceae bacterium]
MTEVTHTLAAGLPDDFDRTGTVYVGIMHPRARRIPDEHKALGIQTEHYYDTHGLKMSTYKWQGRRQRIVDPYDEVLDFSLANKRAYEPLTGGFHFGPWVFPDAEFEFVPGDAPPGLLRKHQRKA